MIEQDPLQKAISEQVEILWEHISSKRGFRVVFIRDHAQQIVDLCDQLTARPVPVGPSPLLLSHVVPEEGEAEEPKSEIRPDREEQIGFFRVLMELSRPHSACLPTLLR